MCAFVVLLSCGGVGGVTEGKKDGRKKGIHTDRKTDRKKEERDTLEWTETTREKGWGGEREEEEGGRRRRGGRGYTSGWKGTPSESWGTHL